MKKTDDMGHSININSSLEKDRQYEEFMTQYKELITEETDAVAIMANTAAALRDAFGFFWVGFYMIKGEQLVLGPFQGNTACYRIEKGRGVCGTAWAESKTQVVPDVEKFPGHIACSSLSRSEIVVPLKRNGTVLGVLDIDSDCLSAFDETDRKWLEKVADLLVGKL